MQDVSVSSSSFSAMLCKEGVRKARSPPVVAVRRDEVSMSETSLRDIWQWQ